MAATMNDSGTAGPAWSAAASPVRTKMPAPMMAPMPSMVRFVAVRARLSDRSLVASASARRDATDLVAQRFIGGSLVRSVSGTRTSVSGTRPGVSSQQADNMNVALRTLSDLVRFDVTLTSPGHSRSLLTLVLVPLTLFGAHAL